jgi:hypothetical protein
MNSRAHQPALFRRVQPILQALRAFTRSAAVAATNQPDGQIFAFAVGQITFRTPAILSPRKGRWPSSRTLGWDAVDAAAFGVKRDGRAGSGLSRTREQSTARRRTMLRRTVKSCGSGTRCWCQVGGGFAGPTGFGKTVNSQAMVTRRIRRQGERVISRKAIAQGMSDASAEPVCSCAFSLPILHTGPRMQRASGIPRAL